MLVDEVQTSAGQGQRRIRIARIASRVVMVLGPRRDRWSRWSRPCTTRSSATSVKNSIDVLGLTETAISDLVYAGIAVFFLWSFPERLQRGRLLNLLHQLRSTAHIIDMHQLTKDPEQLKPSFVADRGEQAART